MVKPQGVRANSWQDVADLSASLGVTLDAWQEVILEAAMGERSDRTWAAKRVGISVPRQNGKSQLMVARILAGALLFGEKKIVVSAHQADTAREAFAKLVEIIEADGNESLRARLDPKFGRGGIYNAFNREAVGFRNGARVQFKARSGPGGKGFSSDCLLLDEAQILGSRAWTSINSTMSAMRNPQVWLLGTPPQSEDDSYTFELVRRAALDGKSTAAAWCEWSADPTAKDYDPASEYTRWSANPAWNVRINHEVVQGEFETYSPDRFAQDRLGVWPDGAVDTLVSRQAWLDLAPHDGDGNLLPASAPEGRRAYGVKFSPDGSRYALSVAVKPSDGGPLFVEGLASEPLVRGTSELLEFFLGPEGSPRWREALCIVVDGKSHAGAFVNDLITAGVPKPRPGKPENSVIVDLSKSSAEVITASAAWLQLVKSKGVTHAGQDGLANSVACAARRPIGQAGGWGLQSVSDTGDVTPVESVILALHGAMTSKRMPGRRSRAVVMT